MLRYATILLVIASFAGVLGITGIAGALIGIAEVLVLLFIVLIVVSFVYSRRRNYHHESIHQRDGMNMKNSLAPIFRLFKQDPLPFIPIRSITLPMEDQRALPVQRQTCSFTRRTHSATASSEDTNRLSS